MKKLLFLLAVLMTTAVGSAETWTPIGQARWTEGALSGKTASLNNTWNVLIERSDTRQGVFRLQPYANHPVPGLSKDNIYVVLHTENQDAIYLEYYIFNYYKSNISNNEYYHVFQRCPENGADSRYYGTVTDENTIEFPIGSFAVSTQTTRTPISFPSYGTLSTKIHKIVLPEGALDYKPTEESWVNIGVGHWDDPVWIDMSDNPISIDVNIEKSTKCPDNYRAHLWESTYVTIYTANRSKVYITPYSHLNSNDEIITITQNCAENGLNGSYYGTMTDGRIVIPSGSFVVSKASTGETLNVLSRDCIITLPDGYDTPLPQDNGVFMGIIAFNDELTRKPIGLLDENNKDEFTSFVDNLQMGNATLLYYAVDQAVAALKAQTFPNNLSNAVLVTFTDGLDQGSLAMKPEYRTSRGYASHLSELIKNTTVHGCPLEAFAIGLKSKDVYDDELFTYNLESLASNENAILPVNNIDEMQLKLSNLYDNLTKQSSQRVVTIKVPTMSHGDKYRFTLDASHTSATASNVWFEGEFDIDNLSLINVIYHGFTSTAGETLKCTQDGIKLQFTLTDCRDLEGGILDVDENGIDQWFYIPSRDVWGHNMENAKAEDIDTQVIKSSVAIMFALDCSTSLDTLFPLVKSTANSFIDRLAGGNGAGVDNVVVDAPVTLDINDPDVEIYTIQGVRVFNPLRGIYICRKGNIVEKKVVR